MNLADSFSLEETLAYLQSLFDIGEKAAGTQEELKAAKLVESEFKNFGLENVHCEPFTVVSRNYKDCQLKILEPSAETVPCVTGGTCMSTPPWSPLLRLFPASQVEHACQLRPKVYALTLLTRVLEQ